VFYLPEVVASRPRATGAGASRAPLAAGLLLLCATGLTIFLLSTRQEIFPERARFVTFPAKFGQWEGRPSLLQVQVEHKLSLDDYILSDYKAANGSWVNFYVAYYATQRQGTSPHSPLVCIPSGGWRITRFERTSYKDDALKLTLPLNRVIIEKDSSKQLVYYWFVQRGRNVANEYWSKWYLLVDAVTRNRTDGALVRLTTTLSPGESEQDADARLQSFIRDLEPNLKLYLPPEKIADVKMARDRAHGG
jgi:EpsI family protein